MGAYRVESINSAPIFDTTVLAGSLCRHKNSIKDKISFLPSGVLLINLKESHATSANLYFAMILL